ncbi:FAD-dependent oxidoreductase [Streptococcus zalophi]|uniref:FAD-dependent oxidoreductase n=1 Tax=Streptococcus zalophi TaxID=640031 RepID=A0A934UCU1_9STRE|nr:FAD-dependent oxidoreductase [Streptococcus zalophi]MBJ8349110.1 FAD-dependent oxidoreductase [Streptococcus zalophi]
MAKIVIIGGVAGGATAATRLRRLNEKDEIILFEKGEYISFANCGLPYHVGNVIKDRDNLLLQTVEGMSSQYGIDIRNLSEVIDINPDEKTVTVYDAKNNREYVETFDHLIISTGAKPIVPPIKGLESANNIFTLRNIPDMDLIKDYIATHSIQTATVVGGGFIGLEMMENLVELGIQVNLVEMANQVMPNLDFEIAQQLHAQINFHKVNLILSDGVTEIKEYGQKLILSSGQELATEMIILAIGVVPENSLAKKTGLELGFKGGIKVSKRLETSAKDIYAIGDAIEVVNKVTKEATNIPLAWPANRQGRLVADIINGIDTSYPGTQGTSVAKVFELTAASTGNNEKQLKAAGIDYDVIHIHPNSHAGYYPGASPIALKILFTKEGKILGAQAIGTEGVEKRIDVIATAMTFGAKVEELASIELAYAPPYSSAKDPVNLLGYTADNIKREMVETFQWHEVDQLLASGAYFLDIREAFELATGSFDGSKHIPLNQLRNRLDEIPKDVTIHVYCQVGQRGYNAARILKQAGFEVKNLDGGYKTYKQSKYQLISFKQETIPEKKEEKTTTISENIDAITLDACGLQCPGPILKVKESVDGMTDGQVLNIQASDFGFSADIENWAKNTGNTIVDNRIEGNKVLVSLVKGKDLPSEKGPNSLLAQEGVLQETKDGMTMVVFSGDLDKALASMIIASGAAAYGKKVTIFFTFWGLSMLKKQKVKKSGLAKLFDIFLPSKANDMPLSKMNMGGMGRQMIKHIMKEKNVDSLPDMIEQAHQLGVKFVACTMSMDLMGIEKEELFDFVEYGGVATFIGDSENANMQLFI